MRPAGPVVIGRVDAHVGARGPVFTERDTGPHSFVDESAVAVVAKQLGGHAVAADEHIRPPVLVVIEHRDPHGLVGGVVESGAGRDVVEPAAAEIAIELRRHGLVGIGAAVSPHAVGRAAGLGLWRPLHVVADEQIAATVAVVVEPCGADGERRVANARLTGDIGEPATTLVVEQTAPVHRGDEHIVPAVIVVVGHRGAQPVDLDRVESAARPHITKRAVAVVPIEPVPGRPPAALPVLAVDEQQVWPAIGVDIEHGDTAAEQLRIPLVPGGAVVMHKRDAGLSGDVGEDDRRARLGGAKRDDGEGGRQPRRDRDQAAVPWECGRHGGHQKRNSRVTLMMKARFCSAGNRSAKVSRSSL